MNPQINSKHNNIFSSYIQDLSAYKEICALYQAATATTTYDTPHTSKEITKDVEVQLNEQKKLNEELVRELKSQKAINEERSRQLAQALYQLQAILSDNESLVKQVQVFQIQIKEMQQQYQSQQQLQLHSKNQISCKDNPIEKKESSVIHENDLKIERAIGSVSKSREDLEREKQCKKEMEAIIQQLKEESREARRYGDIWKAKFKKIQKEMEQVQEQFKEYSKVMSKISLLRSESSLNGKLKIKNKEEYNEVQFDENQEDSEWIKKQDKLEEELREEIIKDIQNINNQQNAYSTLKKENNQLDSSSSLQAKAVEVSNETKNSSGKGKPPPFPGKPQKDAIKIVDESDFQSEEELVKYLKRLDIDSVTNHIVQQQVSFGSKEWAKQDSQQEQDEYVYKGNSFSITKKNQEQQENNQPVSEQNNKQVQYQQQQNLKVLQEKNQNNNHNVNSLAPPPYLQKHHNSEDMIQWLQQNNSNQYIAKVPPSSSKRESSNPPLQKEKNSSKEQQKLNPIPQEERTVFSKSTTENTHILQNHSQFKNINYTPTSTHSACVSPLKSLEFLHILPPQARTTREYEKKLSDSINNNAYITRNAESNSTICRYDSFSKDDIFEEAEEFKIDFDGTSY